MSEEIDRQDEAGDERTSEPAIETSPAPAPELPRWRTGRVGFPALVVLLVVLGAAGLGAASIGGWGGVAVLVILIVGFMALVTSWAFTS